jgi:hypothetical protein
MELDDAGSVSSASRARRARLPSLVLSDDGNDDDNYDQQYYNSHYHQDDGKNTGSFCAEMLVCQGGTPFGEQLDIFTACRHPLDLLGMFQDDEGSISHQPHNHGTDAEDGTNGMQSSPNQVSGYHAIPRTCEYCGSNNIDHCKEDCKRPRSFFPTLRPPFCRKQGTKWDENDFLAVQTDTGSQKQI